MYKLIFLMAAFFVSSNLFAVPNETEMQSALQTNLKVCTDGLNDIKAKGKHFKEEERRTASSPGGIKTSDDWEQTLTQFFAKINDDNRKGVEMIGKVKGLSGAEAEKEVVKFNEHLKNVSVGCKNMMDGLKDSICHNAGLKEKIKCKLGL
ncbi:MAG: hypothetical protein Q8K37_07100 [Alphaproteobacteria bacterium]|nr:hypothetical protein [Alphaproteobacteria bacterium]